MKAVRVPVVLSIFLVSFGMLLLFITAVGQSVAAPTQQRGVEIERSGDEESVRSKDGYAPEAAGGPDAFGYAFVDSNEPGGPIYSFVEISSTGTAFSLPDSDITGPLSLGFDFDYYGTTYNEVSAVSNGYLWFDNGTSHALDSSPDCPLPDTFGNENYIAAIHDDLDGEQNVPNGVGYYEAFAASSCPYGGYGGACFVVTWDGTYHDSTTDDLTFQVILFDDNSILMQYKDAGDEAGSSSTTGIENSDASIGLTYACDAENSITDNLAIRYEVISGPFYGDSYKTGQETVLKGDPLTYTLFISNSGLTSGTNTIVTDTIPAGTTYIPSSLSCGGGSGSCSFVAGQNAINWTGEIEVGEMVTVEFAVDTTAAACGSPITNIATITDPDAFGSPIDIQAQTNAWDNVILMEDFETTDGGFVANTPPGEWAWGDLVPSTSAPPAANSGTKLWATNLSGDITSEPSDHYLTRTVALPLLSQGQLVWWDWWDGDGSDEGHVTIDGTQVYFNDADQLSWQQHSVDLLPFQGQTVDLVYYYLAGGSLDGGAGWYVDDVSILTCDPLPYPVFDNSSKTAPDTAVSNSTYTYTVTVDNSGGVDAMNTVMTDTIPTGTDYVPGSATNGAIYNAGLNQIEWTGNVTAGQSVDVSFMVTATLGSGVVTNTAVISHSDITTPVVVEATTDIIGAAAYPVCADFEMGSLPSYMFAETTGSGDDIGRVAVTTAFPHNGSYAMDLDTNCGPDGCDDSTLQSGIMVVDLAGVTDVSLDFWVIDHGDESDPEDGVFISDDGGATWAQIVDLTGFPSNYENVRLDLAAAASGVGMSLVDGFMIRFQSFDNFDIPSDGFSFDDICVYNVPILDGSVKSGPSIVENGMPISYTLVLSNSGTTASTNTMLTDTIPAGTTYIPNSVSCMGGTGSCTYSPGDDAVTWAGSIAVGETVTVEFAVDSSNVVCGAPILNIAELTDPDAPGSPFTLQYSTDVWDNILLMEDFEAGDGGFVANTPPGEWAWGDLVPSTDSPPAANSGTKLWATNLSGDIPTEPSDHYLTRTVALPLLSQGQLVWWDWWDEDSLDEGYVTIDGTQVYFIDADQQSWQQHSVDLVPFQAQSVDIVYYYLADGSGDAGAGWYVDDVSILTCDPLPTPDLSNSSKIAPDKAISNSTYTYTVTVDNSGGVDAMNTVMTDTIPTGIDYVPGSATNGAIYNAGLNQIEWTGNVTAGQSVDVSFMVTATLGSGVVTNTAVISHSDITTPVVVEATTDIIGAAAYPVCADFETGSLPTFIFAETTSDGGANGRVQVTTDYPHGGSYAMDIDTDCDGCGGSTLQSGTMIVDLAGETNVALDFWVHEHGDESDPEDGVFISDDGGATWAQIVNLNGFPSSYQNVILDLGAAASDVGMSLVDGFMIRFQSFDNFTIPSDGYSFDDICVEPGVPEIAASPTDFTNTQVPNEVVTQSMIIDNLGSAVLNWDITKAENDCDVPVPLPWVDAVPGSGSTGAISSQIVDVGFDSTGLAPAVYNGLLCINSNDPITPVITVSLALTVEPAPAIDVSPNSLVSTQDPDTQVMQTLTINNIGSADLNWDIVEQESLANFDSTIGVDARQVTSPDLLGNFEVDMVGAERVRTGPPASGEGGSPFAPQGYVLYDNGPLVNSPGTGVGGADESVLQTTSLGMNTLGFGNAVDEDDRVADDFTIPTGDVWQLDQITFFAYQTGSPMASTFISVNLQIWDGEPGAGGIVIWGDTTTDVLIDSTWSYVYRVSETTTGSSADRPIMANTVDLGGLVLPAGTYWLDWQSGGSLASGPFAPPISINGVLTTGNGLVTGDNGATWAPALDSGSDTRQGFPFTIEGIPGCDPNDIPWATASPTSGTTAAGSASDVSVTFDSTGITSGVFTGTLCVNSDDPLIPLVEVPLTLSIGNIAPVAVGDSYTTTQNTTLNVPAPGVLDNDTDVNMDPLTAVLDTTTSDGTLNLNSDGSFTYTPDSGFSGTDSFTYHANDGTDDSNIATVNIFVEVTEYIQWLPYTAKADAAQAQIEAGTDVAAGGNWMFVSLAAFPMMVGMWVLSRRNDEIKL